MAKTATGTRKPPGKKGGNGGGNMAIVPAAKNGGAVVAGAIVPAVISEAVNQAVPATANSTPEGRAFMGAGVAAGAGLAAAFGASKVKALRRFVPHMLVGTGVVVATRALPALGKLIAKIAGIFKPKATDENRTDVMGAGGIGKQMGGEMPRNNRVRDLVN